MKLILLTALAASNISCQGAGGTIENFPAKYVYSVRPSKHKCSRHEIINYDPITVDRGVIVDMSECEGIFGFSADDTGPVFNWIRTVQKEAKKHCK
jgi:hypothetical protein